MKRGFFHLLGTLALVLGSSPRQLAESLKMEADMWAKVIRSTGSARD